MKKKIILAIVIFLLMGWLIYRNFSNNSSSTPGYPVENASDSSSFSLKKGDILIRPNWSWLPGSFPVEGGRKFGHVAVVTENGSGKTIDEALAQASVVEALFYDQATRKFLFRKDDQIREGKAAIAFGNRFKGIRYRLRTPLSDDEADAIIRFLRNQLESGYNILALKKQVPSVSERLDILRNLRQDGWHCATLTWEAFHLAKGLDIDSNQGWLIYPSDIISSKIFDSPGGRVRF